VVFLPGDIVILLDDAQLRFQEIDFWEKLIKEACRLPTTLSFVVASTHLLSGADSPAVLKSATVSNIYHSEILLSVEELPIEIFNEKMQRETVQYRNI
jgi:hypothetical protein